MARLVWTLPDNESTARWATDEGGGSQPDGSTPQQAVQKESVRLMRVQVLSSDPGQDYTYDNGAAGVGATITCADDGVLEIDGVEPEVGDRVIFADSYQEGVESWGIYTVTDVGAVDAPWVLTRATDADTTAEFCIYWYAVVEEGTNYAGAVVSVGNVPEGSSIGGTGTAWEIGAPGNISLGRFATAVGTATGGDGVALGQNSIAFTDALSIGRNSEASAASAVAIGQSAKATAAQATAIGYQTQATEDGVTVIAGPNGTKVILKAPNNTLYYIAVDNSGVLSAVAV